MKNSMLLNQNIQSPVNGFKRVRPQKGKGSRAISATLILTSLVDAFSILVIYLLVNSSQTPHNIDRDQSIELPTADFSEVLKNGLGVKVTSHGYIFKDQTLNAHQLRQALIQSLKEELVSESDAKSLIVQADKNASFDQVSPLLAIASDAGIAEIKFATLGSQ
ncbi:MAG: biopolymer transporter ExbD [Bdellovibrionales bacterium]|nr:biopolymer transporter ExbD [Bdellovibrionales bacterium]